jgi:hypothetical protein
MYLKVNLIDFALGTLFLSVVSTCLIDVRATKSDENHCDWMNRVVAEDNRRSLIVSGLTTLYTVCNTQQPEGAPLFIESKAKFACTVDREPARNFVRATRRENIYWFF